jgi:hypothetical protein
MEMGSVPRISNGLLLTAGMVLGLWLGAGPQVRAQQNAPDNTKTNQGDANRGATTADQQKMNVADRNITKEIRSSIKRKTAKSP